MTQFKKGDRVSAIASGYLPYWANCTVIEVEKFAPYVHVKREENGLVGAFKDSELKLVSTTLDTTKDLQTVDGKAVKYLGTLVDGQIVVDVKYGIGLSAKWSTELRRADGRKSGGKLHSPDDVIVKVVVKTIYRNVYADGSVGETAHADEVAAKARTKYGRVRVGTLKQTFHDGVLVDANLSANVVPWYRDVTCPSGRTAATADFANK